MQRESHRRIDQRDAFECHEDVIQLSCVRFQELTSCRNIEKKIFNLEIATHRTRTRLLTHETRTREREHRTHVISRTPRAQFHLRYSSNRRQRLTTKTHCMQVEEVVGLPDFRRRMPFESQAGIGLRHATAIVDHLNSRTSSINHDNVYRLRPGINGIFDKLFDDACRTLYHLASSNLVRH